LHTHSPSREDEVQEEEKQEETQEESQEQSQKDETSEEEGPKTNNNNNVGREAEEDGNEKEAHEAKGGGKDEKVDRQGEEVQAKATDEQEERVRKFIFVVGVVIVGLFGVGAASDSGWSSASVFTSSDSDGYEKDEEDVNVLRRLVPGQWPRKVHDFRAAWGSFRAALEKKDPRRPTWLVEEIGIMTAIAIKRKESDSSHCTRRTAGF
jgi:hypothetical protein